MQCERENWSNTAAFVIKTNPHLVDKEEERRGEQKSRRQTKRNRKRRVKEKKRENKVEIKNKK